VTTYCVFVVLTGLWTRYRYRLGRRRLPSVLRHNTEFCVEELKKGPRPPVRFNGTLFELRSGYLPNTVLEFLMYLCTTLLGVPACICFAAQLRRHCVPSTDPAADFAFAFLLYSRSLLYFDPARTSFHLYSWNTSVKYPAGSVRIVICNGPFEDRSECTL
jgi:hypothetical protein